jgi:uncharacterized protein with FMN-binding domain
MLSPGRKRESLAGKLLLSSALVAVSLAYGWWQRHDAAAPAVAMAPMPPQPAPGKIALLPRDPVVSPPAPEAQAEPETQDADVASGVKDAPVKDASSPAAAAPPKSVAVAKVAPQTVAPAVPEAQLNPVAPSSAPVLTAQQALQMNLPTEGAPPALPWVTGSPEAGAMVAVPAGQHLQDGDYVSNKHELMWGDVKLKLSIRGGVITGVQVLDFPDHRSQSLYLSQMALPILQSEVIKGQKSQVDTVSSATDTSYTFQDAVAEVITSAIRE